MSHFEKEKIQNFLWGGENPSHTLPPPAPTVHWY